MTREEKLAEAKRLYQTANAEQRYVLECLFPELKENEDDFPHWISVDDELPKINPNDSEWEYSDDVIVALKDCSIAVGRYERDNSIGEHYWVLYGVDKDLIVTHWMPLPSVEYLKEKKL